MSDSDIAVTNSDGSTLTWKQTIVIVTILAAGVVAFCWSLVIVKVTIDDWHLREKYSSAFAQNAHEDLKSINALCDSMLKALDQDGEARVEWAKFCLGRTKDFAKAVDTKGFSEANR